MRSFAFSQARCLTVALLLAGCSGAAATELFGKAQADAGAVDSSVVAVQPEAGTSRPSNDGGDSGHPHDAGTQVDSWRPPPDFACGRDTQDASLVCSGGAICCALEVETPFSTTATYECTGTSADCVNDGGKAAVIRCHNSDDCSTAYCCGEFDGRSYTSVACTDRCDPSDSGVDHYRFCHPDAGNSECPSGQTCAESGLLHGFFRCAP